MTDVKALLRNCFFYFFMQVFQQRNPGKELIESPFIEFLCDTYQKLSPGDRLVVNQPPRTGKSLMVSAYALWRIGHDPTEKILFLSNNEWLAEEHVIAVRKIMQSAWYQQIFPKTKISKGRASRTNLETTLGGGFFAASMQSSLGGVGATIILIDDGNQIADAHKPKRLEKANNKFDVEILSRLNPHGKKKQRGIIVNLQHRIAANDLSGHLIAEGFKYIALALEAPRTTTYRWADKTWTRPAGHVLLENYSKRDLEKARTVQDPPYFYFYQQAQGRNAITPIKETDFNLLDRRNSEGPYVLSIDAAQGEAGSFNVAQVWDVGTRPLHLRRQFREQCGFADFERAVRKLFTRFRPSAILVENAANGPALISRLRDRFSSLNFVEIDPHGSKAERLARHRKTIAAGVISLQATEAWLDDYISEFVHHPKLGSDQVDATTQLLDWAPEKHRLAPSGPLFAGPAGVYASSMRRIVIDNRPRPASSQTRGIAIAQGQPFFKKR